MQRISAQPRQAHNNGSPNNNNNGNETHSRCRGPLPLSRLSAPEPLSPLTEDTPLRYTRRFPSYYHSRQPVRRTVISNNTNNGNDISNPLSPRAPSASWSRPLVLTPERGHRTSMSVTAISSPTTTTTMTTNTITNNNNNNNNVATAGLLEVRKRRSTAGHSVSSSTITPKRSGSHDDVFMDQPFAADPLSVRPTSSHGRSRSAPLMMMAPHDSALLLQQQQQQQMSPPNSHLLSVPQQQSISQAISLHSNKEPQSSAAATAAGAMRLTEVSLNATHPTRSHGRRVQAIDDSFLHAVEDAPPGLLRFVQQQQMQQQQRRRSNGSRGSVSFTVSSMHTTSNSTINNHNNTTTSNNMTTSKLVGSSAELHRNSQHVIHVPSSLPRSSAVTMSTPTTTTLTTTTTTTTNTTTMNTGSHTRLHTNGAEENNGMPETHSNATPLITSLEPPTSVTAVMEVLPVEADEDGAQAMLLHTTRTNSQEVNSFTSPASATLVSTVSLTGNSQGRAANESHVTFGTSSLYNPSWQSLSMRLRCHNGWVGPAHTSPPHMQSPPLPSQLASQASYSGLTARRNSGSHTSRPVRLRLRGSEAEQGRRMTPVTHDISLSAQLRSRSNEIEEEEEEEEEVDETDGSVACVRRMDPTTPNGSAKASEEREDGEGIVYCVRRSKSTLCGNKRLKKEDLNDVDDNVERGMSSRKGGKAVRLSPTQLRSRPAPQPSTLSDDDEKKEEEGKKQPSAQRYDTTTQQQQKSKKEEGLSEELPVQRSAQNGEKVARPLLLHPTPSTSVLSSPTIEATRTGLDVPQCSITSLTSPAIQALSSVTSQPQQQEKEQKETVQVHSAHLGSPPLHPVQPALSSFHAVPNNNNIHHPIHSGRLSFTASQTEIEGAAGTHATAAAANNCAAIDLTTGLIQRPALGEVSGRTGLEPGHQTITTNTAASSLTWSALTQTPTVDHLVDVGWYQREHTALEASLGAGISATSMLFSCDKTPCTSQATAITTRIHCLTLPRVSSALSSCCCCCTGACGGSPLLDGVLRSSGSVMNHHNNTNYTNNNNNSSYNAAVRTTPPIPAMMGSEGEATTAAANINTSNSIGSTTNAVPAAAATGGGGGVVMMGPTCAAHAHSHAPAAVPWRMLTPHNSNVKADATDTPQADTGESKDASLPQQQHHPQDSVGNFLRAGVPHQLELPAHPSGLPTPAVTTTTTATTTAASNTLDNAEKKNTIIGNTTSVPRDDTKQQQNEGSHESECGRAMRAQYYEAQACPSTPCELNESNVSWSNEAPLPRRSISSNHHHHHHRVNGCSAAHKHSHHHHHTHRASRCSISRSTARSGFGSPTRTPLQFLTPPTFTTDALPFTRHLSGASSLELSANAKEDAALSLYTEGSQAPCEESSGPTNSIETSSFGAVSPFGPLPIRNARQRRSTVRAGEVSPWWNAAAFATLHIAPTTTSMNHNTYYNNHYSTACCCNSSRERRGSRMRSEQLREANHSLTSLLTGTTCESKTLLVAPEILEVSNNGSGVPGRRSNSRVCMRPEQGTSPTTTTTTVNSRQANGGSIYSGANPPSGMTTRRQSRSSAKWHSQLPPSSSSFAPLSLGIDDMDN